MIRPYVYFTQLLHRLRDDRGASLVEYALLLALVALVAIAAISTLGSNVNTEIGNVADRIKSTTVP